MNRILNLVTALPSTYISIHLNISLFHHLRLAAIGRDVNGKSLMPNSKSHRKISNYQSVSTASISIGEQYQTSPQFAQQLTSMLRSCPI